MKTKDATQSRRDCIVKPSEFPCSKEDFESLYAEVQKWKDSEVGKLSTILFTLCVWKRNENNVSFHLQMKRIYQSYSDGPKIVEVSLLLDKEIAKLNAIERKKNAVLNALHDYRQEKHLTEMGEPVKWVGYKGEFPLRNDGMISHKKLVTINRFFSVTYQTNLVTYL